MKKGNRFITKKVLAAVMAGLTLAATIPVTPMADWFHASYKVKAEIDEDNYENKVVSKDGVTYIYKETVYDDVNDQWNDTYTCRFRGRDGSVTDQVYSNSLGLWNTENSVPYTTDDGVVYVYRFNGQIGEENQEDQWSLGVIGYNGEFTEVLTLPDEIDGLPVKSISNSYSGTVLFNDEEEQYESEYIDSSVGNSSKYHILIIPEGVEVIEDGALQGSRDYYDYLTWFQLPESIKSIAGYVFDYQNDFALTVSENLKIDATDEYGAPITIGGYQGGVPRYVVVTKAQNGEGTGLYPYAFGRFDFMPCYLIQDGVTISDEFKEENGDHGYVVFDYSDQDEHKLTVKNIQKEEFGDRIINLSNEPIYINGQEYTFEKELTFVEEKPSTCADYGEKAHYEDQFGNKYLEDDESTLLDEYSSELLIDPTGLHTDDGTGKCSVCETVIDNIGAKLTGHSISLDGSIGVNFYMQFLNGFAYNVRYGNELYQNAYMKFTLPDGSTEQVKVIDALNDASSVYEIHHDDEYGSYTDYYYMFRCHVPAKEMTGTIKAQIIVDEENGIVGKEYTYSVKDYADYLFAHVADNEAYQKAAEVVKAMLVYGTYAQKYFNYETDNYAYDLSEAQSEISTVSSDDLNDYSPDHLSVINTANVKFTGANLSLLSETTLRLFFEVKCDIADVEFVEDSNTLEAHHYSGDYYYVEIDNIAAKDLNKIFVIHIKDLAAGQLDGAVSYSPMTYGYFVVSRPTNEVRTEDLKALIKSMYHYNAKAVDYFKGDEE